ncbi:MAG: hypothetical protein GF334_13310 [Candidatus Altiarchaeales archaeon]|nr:hypothetical protein [Candidatus Altiarchaeales archaeon]
MSESRPHSLRYNYGRPDMKLPYRWNDDTPYALPIGPKNLMVTSPYLIGAIDIRWDNPADYAANNGLDIIGVNVYRSFDSPQGPYTKLTDTPSGILYYRDQTSEITVTDEDPMTGGRIITGTNATGDWVVKTYHQPIVIPGSNGEIAESPKHVTVRIKETSSSSWQTVPAFKVVGETGEIFLIRSLTYNHTTNRLDQPILPKPDQGGEIRVGYTYIDNKIETNIYRKVYYKATTIADDPDSGERIETPLEDQEAVSLYDMEKIDWVWAEAIRRNRWILEQGGERVKVFIRKWFGERCACWDEQYRTPVESCSNCYGTGYVGGYDGPYDIIVAPPETEKTIQLEIGGLRVHYDWATWTGPYPLISDRDFVVRQNNNRFTIAHVNPQGSRGAIYQQHFMLAPLPHKDIRYQMPITGGASGVPATWNAYREDQPTDASPTVPEKPEIPDQYRYEGRTVTFENILY